MENTLRGAVLAKYPNISAFAKELKKAQKESEDEDAIEKANLEKAKDELNNEICESMRAEKEFTDEYVQELANKYSMSVDDIEDAIAQAIEANGGAEA